MIFCTECGRWIDLMIFPAHEKQHETQQLLDHTGPHGTCACERFAASCRCPDPVYQGGWAWCLCCHGTLTNAKAPE